MHFEYIIVPFDYFAGGQGGREKIFKDHFLEQNSFLHLPLVYLENKLASLEATPVRNYDPATYSLTGVRCRATILAKNPK